MSYHEVTKMVITTIIKFLTRSHMSTQQSLYWLSGLRWHMYERCACKGQLKANIVVVAFTYLPFLWPELWVRQMQRDEPIGECRLGKDWDKQDCNNNNYGCFVVVAVPL